MALTRQDPKLKCREARCRTMLCVQEKSIDVPQKHSEVETIWIHTPKEVENINSYLYICNHMVKLY